MEGKSGWYKKRKMNRKSWYEGKGPIKNKTVLILPTTAGSGLARKLRIQKHDEYQHSGEKWHKLEPKISINQPLQK